MSAIEITFAVVLLGFLIGAIAREGNGGWRNETGLHPARSPQWWRWGDALWRGIGRSYSSPVTYIVPFASVVGVIADRLDWEWLVIAAAVAWIPSVVLFFTIVLFARPKWAIGPAHRKQPGVFAEWLGAEVPPTPPPDRLLHK